MNTAAVVYQGNLRTEATHLRSGTTILTDAPVDNHGKGEAFSPTDLVGAALVTCIITTMAIAAQGRGWELGQVRGEVLKVMANAPRRISELRVWITFEGNALDAEQRKTMEEIAHNCPVAKGLHPDMIQAIEFQYL